MVLGCANRDQCFEDTFRILLQNLCNLNAAIAYPTDGVEDDHLTRNSVDFHAHMGYTMVGEFHGCGFKFGRWYSLVWMEKHLCDHSNDAPPAPVIPFPQLPKKALLAAGLTV